MSGESGAGERARELAAQLDLLEYGPEHRGFYDIEGATKLIEKVLTEAIEAAEFATEKDCLKVVQRAYYEAYAKSDRLNMRVCAEIEKYMKESQGERHLAGALAAVRLEEREACIQDIQDAVGDWGGPEREHYTQAMQRATEAIKKRGQGLDLWGRPLVERAVEGK